MLHQVYRRLPLPLKVVIRASFDWIRGIQREPDEVPELKERHLKNLKVLPNREQLLDHFPKNAIVAELGVDQGNFSQKILEHTKPAKLHLVDTWGTWRFSDHLAERVKRRFASEVKTQQVQFHTALSTEWLQTIEDDSLDWIYIDTNHRYTTTVEELELARKKVRPSGFIAGHDYTVGNWQDHLRYGVIEAVHGFCRKYDWQIIYLSHETHRHLSFAITPISDL